MPMSDSLLEEAAYVVLKKELAGVSAKPKKADAGYDKALDNQARAIAKGIVEVLKIVRQATIIAPPGVAGGPCTIV